MRNLDDAIYRYLRSLLICLVLVSLLLIVAIFLAEFLKTNVYEGEMPNWVKFVGLGFFGLGLLFVVLMTIGRTGKELEIKCRQQSKRGEH